MGHECGESETQQNFRGNIAHSVHGSAGPMGTGALIYPDPTKPSHKTCYEGSHFAAYKTTHNGVFGVYTTNKMIFSKMTIIDTVLGLSGAIVGTKGEYGDYVIEFNDNKLYGETESPDCPKNGGFCMKFDKTAFLSVGFPKRGKALHITIPSDFPPERYNKIPVFGGKAILRNNEFRNFKAFTKYGKKQSLFILNGSSPDFITIHEINDSKFIDVQEGAMAFFFSPPQGWANLKDCV
jgi:hypothetical protein